MVTVLEYQTVKTSFFDRYTFFKECIGILSTYPDFGSKYMGITHLAINYGDERFVVPVDIFFTNKVKLVSPPLFKEAKYIIPLETLRWNNEFNQIRGTYYEYINKAKREGGTLKNYVRSALNEDLKPKEAPVIKVHQQSAFNFYI